MKKLLMNKTFITITAYLTCMLISITILIALFNFISNKINENRCYNLPLNKFYQDKSCLKYVEE